MTFRLPFFLRFCSTLLLLFTGDSLANGQFSLPGKPLSYDAGQEYRLGFTEIMVDRSFLQIRPNADTSLLKPAESGSFTNVFFSPEQSGSWDTLRNGMRVWRFGFYIQDASVMNVLFSPYHLYPGVRLFLYDARQKNILGAFTDKNNKPYNKLATANLETDSMVIELQVPPYVKSYGELAVSGIYNDFAPACYAYKKDIWYDSSGVCNVDINCETNPLIQQVKKSVVRIFYRGTQRCTGTLVNTTQHNGANYILTAGHCITRESDANNAVFFFNYESPYCNGPDGSITYSLSGATIRASGERLDFALLELLEPIPYFYKPYYAGWNYTSGIPQEAFTIHHPAGDVKKISHENHPLSVASFGKFYKSNAFFYIPHWETGTTEPGSSGAPLFNKDGLIIGTLTGGYATCLNPVRDYFQMLHYAWNDHPSVEKQLAEWLDPLNLTNGYLNGFDPYGTLSLDTLTQIQHNDPLTLFSDGLTSGTYSGHNSSQLTGFAEKFIHTDTIYIKGLILHVAQNDAVSENSNITVTIWEGSTGSPGEIIYSKQIFMSDLAGDFDNYIDFDTVISAGPEFFAGYEISYEMPDTFSVYMAPHVPGTAYVSNGFQWWSLSSYTGDHVNASLAVYPVVFNNPAPFFNQRNADEFAVVYPNPAGNSFRLIFKEISKEETGISIFSMQGRLVFEEHYNGYQHIIPVSLDHISDGIYIIRINQGNRIQNLKVAVIK